VDNIVHVPLLTFIIFVVYSIVEDNPLPVRRMLLELLPYPQQGPAAVSLLLASWIACQW
jgi:hypothetical protein